MVALLLLVVLTLMVHQGLLQPLNALLQPWLDGRLGLGALLVLGLWLFAGPRRSA